MSDSMNFLMTFTASMKREIGKDPIGFYRAFHWFKYYEPYQFDEEMKKLEELKTVSDKILSILYHPAFHVDTNEIILRSEQAGKLSHDSFSDTMRDARLWKEKNHQMVPEYVHSVETIDSIDIYENRFISLLIDEIYEDLSSSLEDMTPMVESIGEHYQNNEFTLGKYSPIRDMRAKHYPYTSFILKRNGSKEELYASAKRIKRRMKNMKGTEFYSITSKHKISPSIRPTNILIHDKLYSYCYRYYVSHYKTKDTEERKNQILYFNYFFCSFLRLLKERGLLNEKNRPSLSFDNEEMMTFSPFSIKHEPFTIKFDQDKTHVALLIDVTLHFDKGNRTCSYSLLCREKYSEKNVTSISSIRNQNKDKKFILITGNNLMKDYDSTITFSYRKKKNETLLDDLLSSFTILIDANKEFYTGVCPVCGRNEIRFDGEKYICQNCHTEYVMDKIASQNLLWIQSYRKE